MTRALALLGILVLVFFSCVAVSYLIQCVSFAEVMAWIAIRR